MKTIKQVIFAVVFLCGVQGAYAQPATPAPTPTHAQSDVVSCFSDHYTTVGKSLEPQTWGTNPTTVLEMIAGTNDKIARIPQGNSPVFCSGWNINNKRTIHVDVYTDANNATFNMGLDHSFSINAKWPADFTWPALKKGEWVSVEIPVSAYANAGLTLDKTTSLRFVAGNGTVYIDNLYAYGDPDGTIIPEDDEVDIPAAPTPIHLQADVVSAFGDYYTLNTKGWTPQNWSAVLAKIKKIKGTEDKVVELKGLGESANFIDTWKIQGKTHIHLDVYWAGQKDGTLTFGLFDNFQGSNTAWLPAGAECYAIENQWVSLDVPISYFSINLNSIIGIRVKGSGNFYVDNLYAYVDNGQTQDTDANLKSLTVTPGALTPTFSAATTQYKVNVDEAVTSVVIAAETNSANAAVSGTGTKDLVLGNNDFDVVVTADAGNTKTYRVTVVRGVEKDSDASLKSLSVAPGTLSPPFDPAITAYQVSVDNVMSFIQITAEANSNKATLTGAGAKNLIVGGNSFDIVVTAESGNTRTYTLSVFRNYPAGIEQVASSTIVSGANGVISAVFDGKANVKLYSITGQLLRQSLATGSYSQTVDKGIYILSIDGKTYKIAVR
jgi:hypothetical protein